MKAKKWRELLGLIPAALALCSCNLMLDAAIRAAGAYSSKEIIYFLFSSTKNAGAGLTSDCVGTITGDNISVTLPTGCTTSALIPSFITSGERVTIGSVEQVSGVTVNDFTAPVVYTVTAADSTTRDYIVTANIALSTSRQITTFSFTASLNSGAGITVDRAGVITGTAISVSLPNPTNVTSLVATFTTTGAEVRVGSVVQVSEMTANDFTSPVTYTVVAADSSTTNYTVTVAESPLKDMTSFGFSAALNSSVGLTVDCSGVINGTDISVPVPYGTDITSLVATFVTTGYEVEVNSTVQASSTTENDFTNPVTYIVTAADSTKKSYTVSLTENPWHTVGPAVVSSGGASNVSLALGSSTTAYIAFSDSTMDGNVTVMNFESGSWQTIGAAGFSAEGAGDVSLYLDHSDVPYVAYISNDFNSKVTVMKYASGSWQTVGVAGFNAGQAASISLCIDSFDIPYVAYSDNFYGGKTTVMKYDGGSWQTVGSAGFSPVQAANISLCITSSNIPYVAYKNWYIGGKANVMKYESGSWQTIGAADFSAGMTDGLTMALDSSGIPYVAYKDGGSSNKATVMKYDSGMWQTVGAAGFSAGIANYLSLALDSEGIPFIAYRDAANGGRSTVMKYAGALWQNVGEPGFSKGAILGPSLAIDSSGSPWVAYKNDGIEGNKATLMKYR